MTKTNQRGRIIIPANAHPWNHELYAARILALAGHRIEFIPESNIKTADILLDGTEFEIKTPKSSKLSAVGRNLSRGSSQSPNIIFSSYRMKNVRDNQITHILITYLKMRKRIRKIIFINKHGQIIDINALI